MWHIKYSVHLVSFQMPEENINHGFLCQKWSETNKQALFKLFIGLLACQLERNRHCCGLFSSNRNIFWQQVIYFWETHLQNPSVNKIITQTCLMTSSQKKLSVKSQCLHHVHTRAATAASSWVIYVPTLRLSGSSSAHGHHMNSWVRHLIGCQAELIVYCMSFHWCSILTWMIWFHLGQVAPSAEPWQLSGCSKVTKIIGCISLEATF